MEINRTSKPKWIGFRFTSEDRKRWSWERLEAFKDELKERLPRGSYVYNDKTTWWSISREYAYIFDELRDHYFKDERQGGLFE